MRIYVHTAVYMPKQHNLKIFWSVEYFHKALLF